MELLKSHTGHIHKEDILKALAKTKKSAHTKMVKLLDWSPTHQKIENCQFNFEPDSTEGKDDLPKSTLPPVQVYPFRKVGRMKKLENVAEEMETKDEDDSRSDLDPDEADQSQECVSEKFRPRRSNSCPLKRRKPVSHGLSSLCLHVYCVLYM